MRDKNFNQSVFTGRALILLDASKAMQDFDKDAANRLYKMATEKPMIDYSRRIKSNTYAIINT